MLERVIQSTLEELDIQTATITKGDDNWSVSFSDIPDQLRARDLLSERLGTQYTTALNLSSNAPSWLLKLSQPMRLGLDLRGGVHFLMQVDVASAIERLEQSYVSTINALFKDQKIYHKGVSYDDNQIVIRFDNAETRKRALEQIASNYPELEVVQYVENGDFYLKLNASQQMEREERTLAIQQNLVTLRNRVNELGISEPVVQRQGNNRILVQLPGVQDTTRAKQILGTAATLEYRLVHGLSSDWYDAQETGRLPYGTKLYTRRADGSPVLLKREVIVTGDQIRDARAGIDQQSGTTAVFVTLDAAGARRMERISAKNIGKLMAVVFIERTVKTKIVDGKEVKETKLDETVINDAVIRDVLSNRFQTTGLGSQEARDLALLLRSGALRAPMEIVEERTVGPSLGRDNIEKGLLSMIIGFVAVLIFMVIRYRVFGLFANVALLLNLVFITAALSLLQATLTLPGIAGIVLTIGMAIDANILIFERIREELRSGNAIQSSINLGYAKAFGTIADANITTLITAIVLFVAGTGPIKGFAVTLSIGILTSVLTAIIYTRALVNGFYGAKHDIKKLPI